MSATVSGSNFTNQALVYLGGVRATVTRANTGKKKDTLIVTIPTGPTGARVDVVVTTSEGSGILRNGFQYAPQANKCGT